MDYGIIGNCKTAALVKKNGSIDWFCYPNFDSPSIFAKLLDPNGGHFSIKGDFKTTQKYLENTNVLETYFSTDTEEFVVIDFFGIGTNNFFRLIKPIKGTPHLTIEFNPKPDYARKNPELRNENGFIILEEISLLSNANYTDLLLRKEFILNKEIFFSLGEKHFFTIEKVKKLLKFTIEYWQNFISSFNLKKELEAKISRSLLVLKILTYNETGAILAAATTSIPEIPGEERNWDYRFCWIRDGSFAADIFSKLGSRVESEKFINFICKNYKKSGNIQILYGINGETNLEEKTLDHLNGFKNSKPVRIGNAAYNQDQFDIAGEFLDLVWNVRALYSASQLEFFKFLVDFSINRLNKKDQGLWEIRTLHEHFTFSKLMCYVAIDRGIKIAFHYNMPWPIEEWKLIRDSLKKEILEKSWNGKAFSMYYGSEDLDSAIMLMSYYGFIDPTDKKFVSTINEIEKKLSKNELLIRYNLKDDFGYMKTAFTISSFWFVESLIKIGQKNKAKLYFEKLLNYSNHLGLFSEGIDFDSKEILGNFPQAYSHIGLINAAIHIYGCNDDS